jgi:pSer/pThr/pTyr-binding forkhead associated (FHA) protein
MDDSHAHTPSGGLPLQGPHWNTVHPELPNDFCALRLVLQATGQSVELDRPVVLLGRHSEADVRLPLPDVSRRHCRFSFADGGWCVADLNSLNGTFVNGQRVVTTALNGGDTLKVGGFTFTVELVEARRAMRVVAEDRASREGVLRSIADALPLREGSSHTRRAS